ncbi:MAG: Coenzyme F420 hydrogenase/dehydrogenase, beta subunit C-terminal domain [Lachnospiraceae bacterium]|jgi:coenzyme F420-reducing hydrogenase beta subunit|nr:Coenzyme F420 hydrogenase/dehydrogenase, beta subunit C-terminal domain [Lachnospiraceae bacterium]
MKLSEEGFLRPCIDASKCLNCGLCRRICIYGGNRAKPLDSGTLYSAYAADSGLRGSSSSGGVAAVMARQAIGEGSFVCGAVYDLAGQCPRHTVCSSLQQAEALQGSKYLQSRCREGFAELIAKLRQNSAAEAVVFATPCQVAGLDAVLTQFGLRQRVILIDNFCHGVPTYLLWQRYLEELERNRHIPAESIEKVTFRDKRISWHRYYMHISGGGRNYCEPTARDSFLSVFTGYMVNQRECLDCRFRNASAADVRLGDFWGRRYRGTEKGYSMMLVLTEAGKKFCDRLDGIERMEVPVEERKGQQHEDYPFPRFYDRTIAMLKAGEMPERILELYVPERRRKQKRLRSWFSTDLLKYLKYRNKQ